MPKQIDEQAVNTAHTAYNSYMTEGMTHKQAITATAEALEIPRRRLNDWANQFDWQTNAPVSEGSTDPRTCIRD